MLGGGVIGDNDLFAAWPLGEGPSRICLLFGARLLGVGWDWRRVLGGFSGTASCHAPCAQHLCVPTFASAAVSARLPLIPVARRKMAPRPAAQAKPKAQPDPVAPKPRVVFSASSAPASSGKKALLAEAEAKRPQRRRLGRRATDEQTDRAIEEHFKDWTAAQTDLVLIEGQSLRQRLASAMHDKNLAGRKNRLGSSFWSELRTQYSGSESSALADPFFVEDNTAHISPELLAALQACKSSNTTTRTKAPLVAYMSTVPDINGRELCGLARHRVVFVSSLCVRPPEELEPGLSARPERGDGGLLGKKGAHPLLEVCIGLGH